LALKVPAGSQFGASPNANVPPSEIEVPTEMVEETQNKFVEFELNNQDQFNNSCGESDNNDDEEDQISENIVTGSS